MNRLPGTFLFASVIAMLALAACKAEAPQPAAAGAPAGAVVADALPVATEIETTMAEPGVQPDADAGDTRALAGTWSGLLPCADCPGIDETLVLDAGGGFVLTDTYRERPGTANVVRGSWTIEAGGQRIRLDPGNKDDIDRFFAVDPGAGTEALVPLDTEGQPIDSPFDMRLVRER